MQPKSQGSIPGRYRSKYIEDALTARDRAKINLDDATLAFQHATEDLQDQQEAYNAAVAHYNNMVALYGNKPTTVDDEDT